MNATVLLMEEILHKYGKYPIIYRVLYRPGGVVNIPLSPTTVLGFTVLGSCRHGIISSNCSCAFALAFKNHACCQELHPSSGWSACKSIPKVEQRASLPEKRKAVLQHQLLRTFEGHLEKNLKIKE